MVDTIPGNSSTTTTLNPSTGVDVVIETNGDHDWFRVDLTAGTTYSFQTWSQTGSNPDSHLRLWQGSTMVAENDDIIYAENTYSLINYTPTTSGTYYIDAGTYGNQTTGTMRLTVATVNNSASDTVGNTVGTATPLAMDGVVTGAINAAGDRDVYAISLVAGQTYFFRTGLTATGDSLDSILTLRDAAGDAIKQNDDAGAGLYSGIRYTATTSGTYYLDVSSYGSGASSTGNFTLTAYRTTPLTVYTNDQIARQLTNDYWGGSSHSFAVTVGGTLTFNVTGLTSAAQTLAREALNLWSDVTGLRFSEVTTAGAQLIFDDAEDGAATKFTFDANGALTASTVNVSLAWLSQNGTSLNSYSFQTFVHEIGHALGLGHAGNYNSSASYGIDAAYANDSWSQTVMSYFSQTENEYLAAMGWTRQFVVTPMVADAIAMTTLYGTNTTTRTGNTTYGFNNNSGRQIYDAATYGALTYAIIDNGGIDTMDYSGFGQNQYIDLRAEAFSNIGGRVGNVSIARGTIIENAVGGAGADTIIGNSAANNLNGGAGNDALDGGDGNDTLVGGLGDDTVIGGAGLDTMMGGVGNDTYYVDNSGDAVVENAGEGIDMIYATANFASTGNIETIALMGVAAINAQGDNLDNVLIGNAASNTIRGMGGNDTIYGGDGADILYGDDGGDMLIGGNGDDAFAGGLGNDAIDGGSGNDSIAGNEGDDVLIGGAGIDLMTGGSGNDVFYVDHSGDAALENAGEGIDTVYSTANFSLTDHVETLALMGSAANGSGNAQDNTIIGNGGANVLHGMGGNDTVYGGDGDDVIYGDDGSDMLIGGSGADAFSGGLGDDAIDGGDGNDSIAGNEGNDILIGGAGADLMAGGAGNDTYYIDNGADQIVEYGGEGTDTVYATVDWTLADNIEVLALMGGVAVTGSGNSLDNTIIGNGLNNILFGHGGNDTIFGGDGADIILGGAGNDMLYGNAGADRFVFQPGSNIDRVADFERGTDQIDLSYYGFTFEGLKTLFVQEGDVGSIHLSNGDVIYLHHVTMSQLTAADFVL